MRFRKIQSHSLVNVSLKLDLLSLTVLNGTPPSNSLTLKISGLYFIVPGAFMANWCYKETLNFALQIFKTKQT